MGAVVLEVESLDMLNLLYRDEGREAQDGTATFYPQIAPWEAALLALLLRGRLQGALGLLPGSLLYRVISGCGIRVAEAGEILFACGYNYGAAPLGEVPAHEGGVTYMALWGATEQIEGAANEGAYARCVRSKRAGAVLTPGEAKGVGHLVQKRYKIGELFGELAQPAGRRYSGACEGWAAVVSLPKIQSSSSQGRGACPEGWSQEMEEACPGVRDGAGLYLRLDFQVSDLLAKVTCRPLSLPPVCADMTDLG